MNDAPIDKIKLPLYNPGTTPEVAPPDGPMAPSGPASQSPELADPAADFVPSGPPSDAARYAVGLTVDKGNGTDPADGRAAAAPDPADSPDTAGGDGPNEPPDPPDAPTAPDTPEDPKAKELAEMQRSLRSSTSHVVNALADQPMPSDVADILAFTSKAISDAEGPQAAREFLGQTAQRVHALPRETIDAWIGLYANGDPEALAEARRAIALASEQIEPPELRAIDPDNYLGSQASANHLVSLVEAGDAESLGSAKALVNNTPLPHRVGLLARLYASGDLGSIDSALDAAKEARRLISATGGDGDYRRIDQALNTIARAAIKENRPAEALHAINAMTNDALKVSRHADLYQAGRHQSLETVRRFLADSTPEQFLLAEDLERKLALGGHEASQLVVAARIARGREADMLRESFRLPMQPEDVIPRLDDLETMHKLGSETSADSMVEIARISLHPQSVEYLVRVGKQNEAAGLARELFNMTRSLGAGERLLTIQHDPVVWRTVFAQVMAGDDVRMGARLTTFLGANIKRAKNPPTGA